MGDGEEELIKLSKSTGDSQRQLVLPESNSESDPEVPEKKKH